MTQAAIAALRATLDRALAGQEDAKTGLLLALLAREHAYLEGPPGSGKSRLAQALVRAATAAPTTLTFHRDTRWWDLLGDTHLRREVRGGCERLVHESVPGPLLRAELALLDDLGRAPAEALGPLLRILSERSWGGRALPLESAVATALPARPDAFADPLEPTQLDRFAIQVRMPGLLWSRRWAAARAALDGKSELPEGPVLDAATRARLQEQAARIPIPEPVLGSLLAFVSRLRGLTAEGEARLSDRAFGRAVLRVLRAHALLRGGCRVERADLRALRYMLARRLPDLTCEGFDELLRETAAEPPRVGLSAAGSGASWGAGGEAAVRPVPASSTRTRSEELGTGARASGPPDAEVERILRALEGRLERGRASLGEDPGGSPRRYRALRRLDEIFDADPVEAVGYVEGVFPGLPRSYRRERQRTGGSLALLRDVSASMEGRLSRWAGGVVAGIVRAGARRPCGWATWSSITTRTAITRAVASSIAATRGCSGWPLPSGPRGGPTTRRRCGSP